MARTRRLTPQLILILTTVMAVSGSPRADETAEKQLADKQLADKQLADKQLADKQLADKHAAENQNPETAKTSAGPKANEAVRAKEGSTTALPSVAGRPVRRYAEQGILELGGSISVFDSKPVTQISASPSFGWFFIDYVALSLITSVEYVKTLNASGKGRYAAVIEPSFHIQVIGGLFGFFGAGVGSSYAKTTGFGVEIAPRGGINLLVGGSGVLTAAFSYVYVASRNPDEGQTEPNSSQTGFQMGYTVAW